MSDDFLVEIFPWNEAFATGIAQIDLQHRRLIELLNILVAHLACQRDAPAIDQIMAELKDYAAIHFTTEEAIWSSYFSGDSWEKWHQSAHTDFVAKIVELSGDTSGTTYDEMIEHVVSYLTHWLALHIIESDKRMAKVVLAMPTGISFDRAKELASMEMSGATRVLIDTVMGMYDNLSHRTIQLTREINARIRSEAELKATQAELLRLKDEAAERERANMIERLSEAGRMEALGMLAGGIAHEINTPVQYVGDNLAFIHDGSLNLLSAFERIRKASCSTVNAEVAAELKKIDLDFLSAELPAAADQAREGLERVASIVQAIKEFCYPLSKVPKQFDLNHVIQTAVLVTRSQWKYVAEVDLDLQEDLPLVTGIEGEINQVLVNLIVNAAHAIGEKDPSALGRITVSSRQVDGKIEISVTDTGIGIPEANRKSIFEMFFTTKPPGLGTGQGLAISSRIVRRHNGSITVDSHPGEGTCFRIRFPLYPGPADGAAEA